MNQKRFINIILVVLFIVATGMFGYFVLVRKPETLPVEQPQSTNTQQQATLLTESGSAQSQTKTTSNLKTYKDNDFEISIPFDWNKKPEKHYTHLGSLTYGIYDIESLKKELENDPNSFCGSRGPCFPAELLINKNFLSVINRNTCTEGTGYCKVEQTKNFYINGISDLWFIVKFSSIDFKEGVFGRQLHRFLVKNNKIYYFMSEVEYDEGVPSYIKEKHPLTQTSQLKLFQEIMSSFKIKDF